MVADDIYSRICDDGSENCLRESAMVSFARVMRSMVDIRLLVGRIQ